MSKKRFFPFLVNILPLADPDPGSQNLADPMDPDPKQCICHVSNPIPGHLSCGQSYSWTFIMCPTYTWTYVRPYTWTWSICNVYLERSGLLVSCFNLVFHIKIIIPWFYFRPCISCITTKNRVINKNNLVIFFQQNSFAISCLKSFYSKYFTFQFLPV